MPDTYRFGRFELRRTTRQLLVDGSPAALGSRAFDLLDALIDRRERLVTKNELLEVVWPGLVVEENNLAVHVRTLRKLLGPQAIATIPGRGYRFAVELDDHPTRAAEPAPEARVAHEAQMPFVAGPLYGRAEDIATVRTLLESHRAVTIVGAGGMGKTRLALAVAQQLQREPTPCTWVELLPVTDPAHIPLAIATALSTPLDERQPPLEGLVHVLGRGDHILVLDNGEHLIDALARIVNEVAKRCPGVRVLCTSRAPLRIAAEAIYRLQGLGVPDPDVPANEAAAHGAVALFSARARAADHRFELDEENTHHIAHICHKLQGMPLAIEFAAARVPALGVSGLAKQIGERVGSLSAGGATVPTRHQTMAAVVDWSYRLLSDEERAFFRHLAVFHAGFSLEGACAIGAHLGMDAWAASDMLVNLIDHSLVAADTADPPRYSLLESARSFALQLLEDARELDEARRVALVFLSEVFEEAYDLWLTAPERTWRMKTFREGDNVYAALDLSFRAPQDQPLGVRLASAALVQCLVMRRVQNRIGRELLDRALSLSKGIADARTEGRLWFARTMFYGFVDREAAYESSQRAVACFRECGDERAVAHSLIEQSRERSWAGQVDEAKRALSEAQAHATTVMTPTLAGLMHLAAGFVHMMEGDPSRARESFAEAVRNFELAGASSLVLQALSDVGDSAWACEDFDAAESAFREALVRIRGTFHEHSDVYGVPLMNLAGVLVEKGELDEGGAMLREALPVMMDMGQAWAFYDLLSLRLALARGYEDAARLHGAAIAAFAAHKSEVQPNEKRLRDKVDRLLRDNLRDADRERLMREGALLSEEAACRLALDG